MFRTILVFLITILLILLVPIDSSDAQLVENKSGFKRQILNFDKTNNVFGKLGFLDIKSNVSDDPEFPSWIFFWG